MALNPTRIKGVWATILLKVNSDDTIDVTAIDRQVSAYSSTGCDGVYCGGTAAEIHSIDEPHFRKISIATATAAKRYGLPFQIGAAHPLATESLVRIAFASQLSPLAIQVTLPDWTAIDFATAGTFLVGAAEAASGVPLVLYNPPHARTVLSSDQLLQLCDCIPSLAGLKCGGGDAAWYRAMAPIMGRIGVFVPGHTYATGIDGGASGAYSNMACLSPSAAVRWAALAQSDISAALALELRIAAFIDQAIAPILAAGYPGFACDKAMAAAGGWTDITPRLLWPYASIPDDAIAGIAAAANRHIPEFAGEVAAHHA